MYIYVTERYFYYIYEGIIGLVPMMHLSSVG